RGAGTGSRADGRSGARGNTPHRGPALPRRSRARSTGEGHRMPCGCWSVAMVSSVRTKESQSSSRPPFSFRPPDAFASARVHDLPRLPRAVDRDLAEEDSAWSFSSRLVPPIPSDLLRTGSEFLVQSADETSGSVEDPDV